MNACHCENPYCKKPHVDGGFDRFWRIVRAQLEWYKREGDADDRGDIVIAEEAIIQAAKNLTVYTPPPVNVDVPAGLTRRGRLWCEFLKELDTIHQEQVPLEFVSGDEDRWGTAQFKTARGWLITVFIDAGSWDYIETATTPSGIVLCDSNGYGEATDAEYLDATFGTIYNPDEAEQRTVWGIKC